VCNSLLRPYNAPLSKWPGTKAKVSTRPLLCSAHQYGSAGATQDFNGHEKFVIDTKDARIVKRMIRERFEGDDYMLMTEALGIGEDVG
jgi:hypothetical protein